MQGVRESSEIPRTQEAVRISYTSDAELTRGFPYYTTFSSLLPPGLELANCSVRVIQYCSCTGRESFHSEKPPRLTKTIICLKITL